MLAAAILLAAAAAGPVETVTAASSSLSGTWRIAEPKSVALEGVGSATFGALEDRYCRFEQAGRKLRIHCLGPYLLKDGDGTVDGTALHLAWGSMMLRFAIDATVDESARFDGVFAAKLSGIRYDDPDRVTGTRLVLAGPHPDTAGLGGVLREAISEIAANGAIGMPNDAHAIRDFAEDIALLTHKELQVLGRVTMTIDLGPDGTRAEFYDVEFEHGNRLCALNRRADGVLDAFVCT